MGGGLTVGVRVEILVSCERWVEGLVEWEEWEGRGGGAWRGFVLTAGVLVTGISCCLCLFKSVRKLEGGEGKGKYRKGRGANKARNIYSDEPSYM